MSSSRRRDWSDWTVNPQNGQTFRWRLDHNGTPVYEFQEPPATFDYHGNTGYPEYDTTYGDETLYGNEDVGAISSGLQDMNSSLRDDTPVPSSLQRANSSGSYGAAEGGYTMSNSPTAAPAARAPRGYNDQPAAQASGTGFSGYSQEYQSSAYPQTNSPQPYLNYSYQQTPENQSNLYSKESQSNAYYKETQTNTSPDQTSYANPQAALGGYYPAASSSSAGPSNAFQASDQRSPRMGEGHEGGKTPRQGRITKRQGNYNKNLDSNFKVYDSKDFTNGQVIKVLWSEPTGENARSSYASQVTDVTKQWHKPKHSKEEVFTKVRRFVIFKVGKGYNSCVPILTYHKQGTKKAGLKQDEHAIIYAGESPPALLPNEVELGREPIQMSISSKTPWEKIDLASRIHYAKTYTVEHNVRVLIIGRVEKNSSRAFIADLNAVQEEGRWANE